jgi:hypothetical protein
VTVDELISLTEGLLSGATLADVRASAPPILNETLSDEQYVVLVRFLAGERPVVADNQFEPLRPEQADIVARPRRQRNLVPIDEDEYARRLAALEELDEDTPGMGPQEDVPPYRGPVDIGDGVTLGL